MVNVGIDDWKGSLSLLDTAKMEEEDRHVYQAMRLLDGREKTVGRYGTAVRKKIRMVLAPNNLARSDSIRKRRGVMPFCSEAC